MSAEAAAYLKLYKIYKELKRQNEIIFEAEKANFKAGLTARMRRLTF